MKNKRHKTRSIWIDITFSLTIILLTGAAILLILSPDKHTASSPDERPSAPPLETEEIDSNYPGIKIITKTSNDDIAPFAIQYPQSTHSTFNEKITDYITNAQKGYLEIMNSKKTFDEKTKGELNISYETLTHSSGNYSFVLVNNSNFSDSPKGQTEIRSFHLNPETGESYTIFDLLDGNSHRLNELSAIVQKAIEDDSTLQDHLLSKDVELYTKPLWKNFRNYAITDESMIFYFDEHTIADSEIGPPIISIPTAKIEHLLVDVFKQVDDKTDDTKIENSTEETDSTGVEKNDTTDDVDAESEDPIQNESSSDSNETVPSSKKVALTFDDGPDPKVTRQILETLEKHNAKATFFMLGSRVEYYPEIVKEIQEAGHELGNHTWNHADLTKLDTERIIKEINNTSAIIEKVTGEKIEAFRPPYGAVNDKVRAQSNLQIVLWDVDTLDWKHRNPQKLLQNVKEHTKDGSIVLMHDIHQSTADGLDAVLTYLENEGYQFVTVAEL